jgi:hypothetical protein
MDAITRYDIDDYWTWQSTFTRGGDGVDPTTLTVIVQDPDGVETTVVNAVSPIGLAPTSIPVARIDTGVFQGNPGVHMTAPGYWFVKVKGTGLAAAAETHVAYVEQDPIDVEAPVMYMQPGELADSLALTSGESDDWQPDLVRSLIAASRGVEQLTGQRFWPDANADQVRYYNADRDIVRTDPILQLTSVDIDYRGDQTYSTNLVAGTDFLLEPRNAGADGLPYTRIRRLRHRHHSFDRWQPWTLAPDAIRVTAQFGWLQAPDAIVQATGILASRLLKRFREAPFGAIAGIGLDGAGLREQQLDRDPELGFLLAPYRRTRLFV